MNGHSNLDRRQSYPLNLQNDNVTDKNPNTLRKWEKDAEVMPSIIIMLRDDFNFSSVTKCRFKLGINYRGLSSHVLTDVDVSTKQNVRV